MKQRQINVLLDQHGFQQTSHNDNPIAQPARNGAVNP